MPKFELGSNDKFFLFGETKNPTKRMSLYRGVMDVTSTLMPKLVNKLEEKV